jgi:hypothetical protein
MSLKVMSSESKTPLPFASIVNHNKSVLLFTNEKGIASGNLQNGDSISISYVGYETQNFRIEDEKDYSFELKPNKSFLPPVIIQACNFYGIVEYSSLVYDTSNRKFGGVSFGKTTMNNKVAVMLRPSVKNGYLKAFSVWLKRNIPAPKIAVQAPILFSFYGVNDSSGLPDQLLTNQQIIYLPSKEGKQTVRLDTLNLRIPDNGIYLVIEYVFDEKYTWSYKYVDNEKGIDSIAIGYGVMFDGVFAKDFLIAFYDYQINQWHFPGKFEKSLADKIHGTIKCSAEIRYCKE